MLDYALRFVAAEVVFSMNAAVTVQIFDRVWFSMFSAPRAVLTDRGGAFRSAMFEFVTQQLGACHVYSSPYYPQGNGMNEASHIALNVRQEKCFPGWQVFRQQVNLAQCRVIWNEAQFKRLLSRKISDEQVRSRAM
eukprot:Lankesteria_metandrocarpae@DN5471_c1_g1_i12.p2